MYFAEKIKVANFSREVFGTRVAWVSEPLRDLDTRQKNSSDSDTLGLIPHRSILSREGAQVVEEALTVEEPTWVVIGIGTENDSPSSTRAKITAPSEELSNCRVIRPGGAPALTTGLDP
jgi:hypothetical protein